MAQEVRRLGEANSQVDGDGAASGASYSAIAAGARRAGDRVVSAVAINTPEQHLDFRADPFYSSGATDYDVVELPRGIADTCIAACRDCGLLFAGIDIKQQGDDWVLLELNSSPIYLDVERKLGHPISQAIADMLVA